MNVLVTGGAGYIGSHACKELWRAGYIPITYDNLSRGHAWAVKWGPLENGDLHDVARLREVMLQWRPFAVLHFAAVSYAEESVITPAMYYHNNVIGTYNLLQAMREEGLNKIVFSSSAAVYGESPASFITENCACVTINPYGRTKAIIEQMILDYHKAYGLQAILLRYFNAAGADEAGDIGEAHDEEPHLIPRILLAALGQDKKLTIFGDDYETPDGTCIRDYVHVTDLVHAHVQALQRLNGHDLLEVYNLGSQKGFSVREVIDAVSTVTGREIPLCIGPRRPGDAARLVADSSKARRELKWQPSYNNLESVVETAWRWMTQSQYIREAQKSLDLTIQDQSVRAVGTGKTSN